MRTHNSRQPMAQVTEVKIEDGQLHLAGSFALCCPLPEQDEWLPKKLEAAIESGGQVIKRQLFRQALEKADVELLLAQRRGKDGQGFQRRGRKRYPFKTVFGTVYVRRQQVQQKADGRVVMPSAQAWQTPERMCITAGLRAAVCDAMLEQSVRKTAARVAERAGEANLLSPAESLKIVHEEGECLQAVLQERAAQVLAEDPEAARQLLPAREEESVPGSAEEADRAGEELAEADVGAVEESGVAEDVEAPSAPLGFPGSAVAAADSAREQPRQVDPGYVIVEPDEVEVHAQAATGRQSVLVYTAVILTAARTWHVAAGSTAQVIQQVAAVLACLGVHQGRCSLLFLADGAGWIRAWFRKLTVAHKAMILCWYHLVRRCEQQLSMACKGRKHREEVQAEVLGHLWEGRVDEALAALEARRGEMKVGLALDQLIGYLVKRREYLPNYRARQQAGLWIASNRVEKFNDWSVTERCKHQGMAWTETGVTALATLEASKRNGELNPWRESRQLPPWATQRQAA